MRRKRDKGNKIHGGFVPITYEMINSKAYRELSGARLKTLILCLRKVKTHNPIDRFKLQFTFTYPEARKQGLWDTSFSRGLKLLQQVGFIDFVMPGGKVGFHKEASFYRLSQRWKKYGTSEFEEKRDGYYEGVHGEDVF